MSLANQGDYVAWTYQTQANGTFYTCLTLDPKGKFYGSAGIHLGSDLRTNGYKFYTNANRYVTLQDVSLQGRGTHPGWVGPTALSKVVFSYLRRHGRYQRLVLQHDEIIRPCWGFDEPR